MEYKDIVDQTDYIESAAIINIKDSLYMGGCKGPAPCKSCGGGCYGCKGSRCAEISSSELKETSNLLQIVEEVLD